MQFPIILNFDGSVKFLEGAETICLSDRQELIRFGCRVDRLRQLGDDLAAPLERQARLVFMGSGDYHHVSYLLIERWKRLQRPIQVVVFDNHPDNMRYPFGIHCGSWVRHVSHLPFVSRIFVVGITSSDVEGGRLWENYLKPLYAGKVTYFCVNRNLRAMHRIGIVSCQSFVSVEAMLKNLCAYVTASEEPIYLSIDKDVLSPDVIHTNWDQGCMTLEELISAINALRPHIFAADVVGDVSIYRYRGLLKRFLSKLDQQPEIPDASLMEWQAQHRQVNLLLASALLN